MFLLNQFVMYTILKLSALNDMTFNIDIIVVQAFDTV